MRAEEGTSRDISADPGRGETIPGVRAAEALYQVNRDRIYRICVRHLGDPAAAEDVVQETFLRSAPHLEHLSGEAIAYLTTVARNLCYRELSRRQRARAVSEESDTEAAAAPGPSAEDTVVDRRFLHDVWFRLSVRDRRFLAYHICGYSLAEIAHRTGGSVDTAAAGVSRARRRARRLARHLPAVLPLPLASRRCCPGVRQGGGWLRRRCTATVVTRTAGLLCLAVLLGGTLRHGVPVPSFIAADGRATPAGELVGPPPPDQALADGLPIRPGSTSGAATAAVPQTLGHGGTVVRVGPDLTGSGGGIVVSLGLPAVAVEPVVLTPAIAVDRRR